MEKIIYTRPDGGLSVVHPREGSRLAYFITLDGIVLPEGGDKEPRAATPVDCILCRWPVDGATAEWAETEDEFILRLLAKDVPSDAINPQIVEAEAIPADRTFRDAWKAGPGTVEHDMTKCHELHRARMRAARALKLAELDVQFMRAVEAGDAVAMGEVVARKRLLRDVTALPEIQNAATPEVLKAVWPDCLKC